MALSSSENQRQNNTNLAESVTHEALASLTFLQRSRNSFYHGQADSLPLSHRGAPMCHLLGCEVYEGRTMSIVLMTLHLQLYEVGAAVIPTLQMRKPRFREIQKLFQVHPERLEWVVGFSRWFSDKDSAYQCWRRRFDS